MKSFVSILSIACLVFLFVAGCSKEHSVEKKDTTITSTWSFSEGDNNFKGTVDSAYIDTASNIVFLNLNGTADNGSDKIAIVIYGTQIANGTYTSPQAFFTYTQNNNVIYQSDASQAKFSVNISNLDTSSVSGTFSGEVMSGNGIAVNITNGKFTSVLKKDVIGSIPTGNLTVWASESCNQNDPIEVIINGQKEFVENFTATAPDCGAQGAANYTLPAGYYSVTAICGGDTVNYPDKVLVQPYACNQLQLLH
ncbi:hypothetical protein [Pinibacter aurantiacus]|uniref:Lipoprotein n=1 Tax=Pinibacter aurantiacus TaxID=2851599 RepID=A0A9E2W7R7_9BACT|nr:hypothetical protein [Pinibacter aurantiacus]MBV4357136.1 hypothetical protein [Pinibacter aurantiacus]